MKWRFGFYNLQSKIYLAEFCFITILVNLWKKGFTSNFCARIVPRKIAKKIHATYKAEFQILEITNLFFT
jgi:hypothetical protein